MERRRSSVKGWVLAGVMMASCFVLSDSRVASAGDRKRESLEDLLKEAAQRHHMDEILQSQGPLPDHSFSAQDVFTSSFRQLIPDSVDTVKSCSSGSGAQFHVPVGSYSGDHLLGAEDNEGGGSRTSTINAGQRER